MIIGHVGVAFAARWRWPKVPVAWLLLATLAPDIWRGLLALAAMPWRHTNVYSHELPWCLLLGAGLALAAWAMLGDGTSALVVGGLVLSHVALDVISGQKLLWFGGPAGLDLQSTEQLELPLEVAIAWVGWRLLRQTTVPRWVRSRLALLSLVGMQAAFQLDSYHDRPWLTRCINYPFRPCSNR
jgi:hypothetical protein